MEDGARRSGEAEERRGGPSTPAAASHSAALRGQVSAQDAGARATPTPAAGHKSVQITGLRRDGALNPNEPDEYVEITNQGAAAQDLTGWRLDSERGAASGQVFHFPAGFVMQPGQVCRVYTDELHPEWCGLSFGYRKSGVWNNNEPDSGGAGGWGRGGGEPVGVGGRGDAETRRDSRHTKRRWCPHVDERKQKTGWTGVTDTP